jgi:hypothetical protein
MNDASIEAFSTFYATPTPLPQPVCPYVVSSREGTSYCSLNGPALPEAVRELAEELDQYLDGCPDPAFVRPDWLINKPSRLLWKCRAALRAIPAQAQRKENDDGK